MYEMLKYLQLINDKFTLKQKIPNPSNKFGIWNFKIWIEFP